MDSSRGDRPVRDLAHSGASRLRILHLLRRADTALGLQELAGETGLHPNTVRFHLDRLLADGLVLRQTEARARAGRPRLTFTAIPRPDMDPRRRSYRLLAEMLAGFLATAVPDVEGAAVEIGEAWGRYLASGPAPSRVSTQRQAVGELVRVLEDVGFAPEEIEDGTGYRILLRHCPFLEVAETHREVACSVHLGLMRGVLAEVRAPLVADKLQPFAVPAGCLAHVIRTAGGADGGEPPAAAPGSAAPQA